MRTRWIVFFGAAMLAGALGGALLGPAPAGAVAREIVELQTGVNQLVQGQQAMQTAITQNDAVERTLIQQSLDAVNKLSVEHGRGSEEYPGFLGGFRRAPGHAWAPRCKAFRTTSRTCRRAWASSIRSSPTSRTRCRVSTRSWRRLPPPRFLLALPAFQVAQAAQDPSSFGGSAAPPPSADVLYSNGLRDINGKHYDLATQEFQDYLKYYGDTDLASNAQFYLGEIAFMQNQFQQALDAYNKVIENYPKSFKTASARMRKGFCLAELGQKAAAIRELRTVVRQYPGTDEAKRSAAKLRELGATAG